MWWLPLYVTIVAFLIYLTAATLYLLILAVVFFAVREPKVSEQPQVNRFAVLVPAHNEEVLISGLCGSLLSIDYPSESYEVFVIADNCSDRTVEICTTQSVNVLIRNDPMYVGKGFALK